MYTLEQYNSEVFKLVESIVIKVEELPYIHYYYQSPSLLTPSKFKELKASEIKYYRDICGIRHDDDNDLLIPVIESGKRIPFNLETLNLYRNTKRELLKQEDYYNEFMEINKKEQNYIKGCMFPAKMEKIENSDNGTILTYNSTFIQPQEHSLITTLEDYIKSYFKQYYNKSYVYVDNLYLTAFLGSLYAMLPAKILNIRNSKINTSEAHDFHMEHFFRSYGEIHDYTKVLTPSSRQWLYKNLLYLRKHAGKEKTLRIIMDKVFDANDVGVGVYNVRVPLPKEPEDNKPKNHLPEPMIATTNKLNTKYVMGNNNKHTIDNLIESEMAVAEQESNSKIEPERKEYIRNLTVKKLNDMYQDNKVTKSLNINTYKVFKSSGIDQIQVALDYWIYCCKTGKMAIVEENVNGKYKFIEPKVEYIEPNDDIPYMAKYSTGILMVIKALASLVGKLDLRFDRLRYNFVLTPDITDLRLQMDTLHQDGYTRRLLPLLESNFVHHAPKYISPDELGIFIQRSMDYYQYMWKLDVNAENQVVSANLKYLLSKIQKKGEWILSDRPMTVDEHLEEAGIRYRMLEDYNKKKSIFSLFKCFTTLFINPFEVMKTHMVNFIKLFNNLTSYTIHTTSSVVDENKINVYYNNVTVLQSQRGIISGGDAYAYPRDIVRTNIISYGNDWVFRVAAVKYNNPFYYRVKERLQLAQYYPRNPFASLYFIVNEDLVEQYATAVDHWETITAFTPVEEKHFEMGFSYGNNLSLDTFALGYHEEIFYQTYIPQTEFKALSMLKDNLVIVQELNYNRYGGSTDTPLVKQTNTAIIPVPYIKEVDVGAVNLLAPETSHAFKYTSSFLQGYIGEDTLDLQSLTQTRTAVSVKDIGSYTYHTLTHIPFDKITTEINNNVIDKYFATGFDNRYVQPLAKEDQTADPIFTVKEKSVKPKAKQFLPYIDIGNTLITVNPLWFKEVYTPPNIETITKFELPYTSEIQTGTLLEQYYARHERDKEFITIQEYYEDALKQVRGTWVEVKPTLRDYVETIIEDQTLSSYFTTNVTTQIESRFKLPEVISYKEADISTNVLRGEQLELRSLPSLQYIEVRDHEVLKTTVPLDTVKTITEFDNYLESTLQIEFKPQLINFNAIKDLSFISTYFKADTLLTKQAIQDAVVVRDIETYPIPPIDQYYVSSEWIEDIGSQIYTSSDDKKFSVHADILQDRPSILRLDKMDMAYLFDLKHRIILVEDIKAYDTFKYDGYTVVIETKNQEDLLFISESVTDIVQIESTKTQDIPFTLTGQESLTLTYTGHSEAYTTLKDIEVLKLTETKDISTVFKIEDQIDSRLGVGSSADSTEILTTKIQDIPITAKEENIAKLLALEESKTVIQSQESISKGYDPEVDTTHIITFSNERTSKLDTDSKERDIEAKSIVLKTVPYITKAMTRKLQVITATLDSVFIEIQDISDDKIIITPEFKVEHQFNLFNIVNTLKVHSNDAVCSLKAYKDTQQPCTLLSEDNLQMLTIHSYDPLILVRNYHYSFKPNEVQLVKDLIYSVYSMEAETTLNIESTDTVYRHRAVQDRTYIEVNSNRKDRLVYTDYNKVFIQVEKANVLSFVEANNVRNQVHIVLEVPKDYISTLRSESVDFILKADGLKVLEETLVEDTEDMELSTVSYKDKVTVYTKKHSPLLNKETKYLVKIDKSHKSSVKSYSDNTTLEFNSELVKEEVLTTDTFKQILRYVDRDTILVKPYITEDERITSLKQEIMSQIQTINPIRLDDYSNDDRLNKIAYIEDDQTFVSGSKESKLIYLPIKSLTFSLRDPDRSTYVSVPKQDIHTSITKDSKGEVKIQSNDGDATYRAYVEDPISILDDHFTPAGLKSYRVQSFFKKYYNIVFDTEGNPYLEINKPEVLKNEKVLKIDIEDSLSIKSSLSSDPIEPSMIKTDKKDLVENFKPKEPKPSTLDTLNIVDIDEVSDLFELDQDGNIINVKDTD